ncbi:DUF6143 family protein [Fictibacillus sp. WQ 8-8]|uniref:DUF6143 family protein n=1 Tax=Fictibacillus sp. WQ 8-8 TaxID=2938788 RepID=UPI0006A76048|nr:DUF6143 family protein [Fictibacillus sp. WQ 8-8]MCQ6265590.1 DUF6143 family protein [Fictibacillus sp. WQ 8-8]
MQNRMYPYGPGAGYGYGQGNYGNPNVNPNMNYPNPNISPNMNYPVSPNMNYPVSPNMNVNIPFSPQMKYPKEEKPTEVSPAEVTKANNFLGITETLSVCPCPPGENVWAALVNPEGSGVDLALQRITISNMTCSPINAQIYFKPTLPFNGRMSGNVTPADLSKTPSARPKGQIQFGSLPNSPVNGVLAASRIIPPYKSITVDLDGLWVIASRTNVMVFLTSTCDDSSLKSTVAFEWEEK